MITTVPEMDVAAAVISLEEFRFKRDAAYCGHFAVYVDPNARKITCQKCNAVVDPVDALQRIVQTWENKRHAVLAIEAEIKKRTAELDRLKAEERNVKARLRRAVERERT